MCRACQVKIPVKKILSRPKLKTVKGQLSCIMMKSPRIRKRISYPSTHSFDSCSTDFNMDNDIFHMRVPLETVKIGPWKYIASEFEDIELLYELESSNLLISTNVRGSGGGVPAVFRIKSISAADLSLVSVVPGSLESMVARLVLETDQKMSYTTMTSTMSGNEKEEKLLTPSDAQDLDVGIIKMTASVHESGHLRDVLLFLKCDYQPDVNPNSTYMRPKSSEEETSNKQSSIINTEQTKNREHHKKSHLTFVECLPHWVMYIPWMVYSKRTRQVLQHLILLYSIFTVFWALWQLYRHVNIIHVVIQPIIDALKLYLSSVFEIFDWLFSLFTLWWYTYLSPLNVLFTQLFTPVFNLAMQFKEMFSPFYIYLALSQLLQKSGLILVIKSLFYLISTLFYTSGNIILSLAQVLYKPVGFLWQSILNSRIAVASLDIQNMQIRWIINLIVGSTSSIVRGLAKIVGYRLQEHKKKKAIMASSTPMASPASSPTCPPGLRKRHGNMPLLYSSPVTKQN